MWGRRGRRYAPRSKRVTLGLLAEAMARAEQQEQEQVARADERERGPEPVPYSPVGRPAVPAARADVAADVPVDNSAGPEPSTDDDSASPQRELPAQRSGKSKSTRHGSFG